MELGVWAGGYFDMIIYIEIEINMKAPDDMEWKLEVGICSINEVYGCRSREEAKFPCNKKAGERMGWQFQLSNGKCRSL